MKLCEIVSRKAILDDLKSPELSGAIKEMASQMQQLYDPANFKLREVVSAVMDRERQGSTGKGGIAIPHAKVSGLKEMYALFARSKRGIDCRAPDGEPARAFFLLVAPKKEETAVTYLKALRCIGQAVTTQNFSTFVQQARNAREIHELFREVDEKTAVS